jgi:hypothetical protein
MWFLCMHAIYCWGDHSSMIGGLCMMDSQISILLLLIGNLLVPLTPKQVREDQLKLQRSNEKKKEGKRKEGQN